MKTGFIFRFEHVMLMSYNMWASPRESFCWLNETKVIVLSTNVDSSMDHCELVDIVSLFLKTIITMDKDINTNTTIAVGSAINSVAKM